MRIKKLTAEYIESGAFQGGEEDASRAGIGYGEQVVIMSKKTFKELTRLAKMGEQVRDTWAAGLNP